MKLLLFFTTNQIIKLKLSLKICNIFKSLFNVIIAFKNREMVIKRTTHTY